MHAGSSSRERGQDARPIGAYTYCVIPESLALNYSRAFSWRGVRDRIRGIDRQSL